MQRSTIFRVAALGASLALGCNNMNSPVSSPLEQPLAAHREVPQAETSMIRIDHAENGTTVSRFMVTYNDDTDSAIPDGNGSWMFTGVNSTSGWATSPDGQVWTRKQQLTATQALKKLGLNALHGDPWIAGWNSNISAVPSIALYISVAQTGLRRIEGPWYLAVARSVDSGVSFEDPVVVLGPQGDIPDGPKIAVTGDGRSALAAWIGPGFQYKVLSDLQNPKGMKIPSDQNGVHRIRALNIASPPGQNCTYQERHINHPQVAASLSTFYMATHILYFNGGQGCPSADRLEVYRADAAAAANGNFSRVMSIDMPSGETHLLGQDIQSMTFAQNTDRGSEDMSLAAGHDADGDYVLLVTQRSSTVQGENSHNEAVQYRLAEADSCDAQNNKGDLSSCGAMNLQPQVIDPQPRQPRLGYYELKPHVFLGKVPDGAALDTRVGIVWYTQPYRGQQGNITDEMRARTGMETVFSSDGGKSYVGPFSLMSKGTGPGPATDNVIGDYFIPCQFIKGPPGYFGDYISAAFLDTESARMVATWADSREGCQSQDTVTTHHMHVWSGGFAGVDAPTNACGGTQPLTKTPGTSCVENGQCGRWTCLGPNANAVTCDTSKGMENVCGGCSPMAVPGSGHGRGDFCICNVSQSEGTLVCGPGENTLICCPCNSAPGCP